MVKWVIFYFRCSGLCISIYHSAFNQENDSDKLVPFSIVTPDHSYIAVSMEFEQTIKSNRCRRGIKRFDGSISK